MEEREADEADGSPKKKWTDLCTAKSQTKAKKRKTPYPWRTEAMGRCVEGPMGQRSPWRPFPSPQRGLVLRLVIFALLVLLRCPLNVAHGSLQRGQGGWLGNDPTWCRGGSHAIGTWVSSIASDHRGSPGTAGPSNLLAGGDWRTAESEITNQWFILDLGHNVSVTAGYFLFTSGNR